ncbi:hypothetical protein SDC9_80088 [bioreactor metagenome]|uniref:Uncharacterized protein n=1 Tax=bioreactor metagenome TaxID=1076179 RepID=A0A644YYG5_9ZZZZ
MGLGVGRDKTYNVAVTENFLIAENWMARVDNGAALVVIEGGQPVDALDILCRDDRENALHFFCLGGVNFKNSGVVGLFRLDDGEVQRALRHFLRDVVTVFGKSADLGDGSGARYRRAVVFPVFRVLVSDIGHCGLAPYDFGRIHHGVNQRLVPRAAADVAMFLEPLAHLLSGRATILLQQRVGRHDKCRRAKAALGRAVGDPGLLERMKAGRGSDALNRYHLAVVFNRLDFAGAGADDLAV